jgi:anti-sigma regulatory factor (Ser/Thr protein kinase)
MPEKNLRLLTMHRVMEALQAQVVVGENLLDTHITGIYASDLMSDVLAYGKTGSVLLTGMNSIQTAVSSYMAEFKAIVFLRGKKPTEDIRQFAQGKGLILLTTRSDMYEACIQIAKIDGQLLPGSDTPADTSRVEDVAVHQFSIKEGDFTTAGMISTEIKEILNSIGYDPLLVRRVAISTYEGEMNVVMHALKGTVTLKASELEVFVTIDDEGKGIPDVEKAMQEGFSTATEEQRALGFGSGMGLPNMKRNADSLHVTSLVGKGTNVEMKFMVSK